NQAGAELNFRISVASWRSDRRVSAATSGHVGIESHRQSKTHVARNSSGSCTPIGADVDNRLRGFAVSPSDEFRPSTAQHSLVGMVAHGQKNSLRLSQSKVYVDLGSRRADPRVLALFASAGSLATRGPMSCAIKGQVQQG